MKSKYDENNPYDGLSPADALQKLYDIHNENPDDKGGIREILPDGRIGQKLIDITLDDLADCFKWGVDYGLLLAEQERDSEDLLDAVVCASFARRMNIPSSFAQRRQPHSAAWRKKMGSGMLKFIDLVAKLAFQD